MLQVDELFNIGPFECRVRQNRENPPLYWIGWDGESYIQYLRLVGSQNNNLSSYTRYNLKVLDSKIIYKELTALDSPDFTDLENLTKYVELLRTHLISKQLELNILK